MNKAHDVALVVPTLNAGTLWQLWIESLLQQTLMPDKILIVDSGSSDSTVSRSIEAGFEVQKIRNEEFNHGATRQKAVEYLSDYKIVILITQDAIFAANDSIARIVREFDDEMVAIAYGRQLPHKDSTAIAAHARYFNYPDRSAVKSLQDKHRFGIKTAFTSNSFAAYRRDLLLECGGFPDNTILSEDMYVAANALLHGYKLSYSAKAVVYHSHNYSISQEFKRYFDQGVFHAREPWIMQQFGSAEGEGMRYVSSELRYLLQHSRLSIPSALLRTVCKLFAYKLGRYEKFIPIWVKKNISMHKRFWQVAN